MEQEEAALRTEAADPTTSPKRLAELARDAALAVLAAANLQAQEQLLEELSWRREDDIRQTVVQNPATPWTVLLALSEEFPRAFMANPAVALLLLEDPQRFQQIKELPAAHALKLLDDDDVAGWLIGCLAQHPAALVRETVRSFPSPQTVLRRGDRLIGLTSIESEPILHQMLQPGAR